MEHEVREAHPTLAAGGTGVVHQPALQHLAREGIAVAPPAILERLLGGSLPAGSSITYLAQFCSSAVPFFSISSKRAGKPLPISEKRPSCPCG